VVKIINGRQSCGSHFFGLEMVFFKISKDQSMRGGQNHSSAALHDDAAAD
jgi:hypothetical protein